MEDFLSKGFNGDLQSKHLSPEKPSMAAQKCNATMHALFLREKKLEQYYSRCTTNYIGNTATANVSIFYD